MTASNDVGQTQEGAGAAPVLSGFTIGALTINPTFTPGVTRYTAETSNNTNKVKAVCDDESAAITITLNDKTVENNTSLAWADGENVLIVDVSNTDGLATRYMVTVTKI